jgi:hypothetical protein
VPTEESLQEFSRVSNKRENGKPGQATFLPGPEKFRRMLLQPE